MNKEINFSRFVGIAIVIICIFIVVLALLSAIMQNENNDNMIYVENGSGYTLSVPKSNLVLENLNIENEIQVEEHIVNLKVRLPKINIQTETVRDINEKIYSIYQKVYSEIANDNKIQKIDINYEYEYLNNDTAVEITITRKETKNNKVEETEIKYVYDLKNDVEI